MQALAEDSICECLLCVTVPPAHPNPLPHERGTPPTWRPLPRNVHEAEKELIVRTLKETGPNCPTEIAVMRTS